MTRSVFLFCRVNTKQLARAVDEGAHVAAAYNKCCSMVRAFNTDELPCTLVTVPVLNSGFKKLNKFHWLSYIEDQTKIVQLGSIGWPIVDRIFAAIGFLFFCLRFIRRDDVLVLYNFFPEYIPASLLANIKGARIILDVEDAPRNDEKGLRGMVNRVSFRALRLIRPRGYLTVSTKIVNKLSLSPVVVVYGVVSSDKFRAKIYPQNYSAINIIFGGALLRETGLDVLVATLRLLAEKMNQLKTPLHFFVTGFGETERIKDQIGAIQFGDKVSCTLALDVPFDEYKKILEMCDVGLCLKDPFIEMGDTTFPSKVVEIAAQGLLLISSKVSDVPMLFRSDEALLLDQYDAASLSVALMQISSDTSMIEAIATRGRERVVADLSEGAIRSKFANLLIVLSKG